MRLKTIALSLALAAAVGCATTALKPASLNLTQADALLTQRVVLTIHGRQFTFNGYLSISQTGGLRLIVMQSFGQVVADVLVKPNGQSYIMRPSPLLRPEWIKRFIVRDLVCLYGNSSMPCPSHVFDGHLLRLQDHSYTLDLTTVEVKPGPQPERLFDETKAVLK